MLMVITWCLETKIELCIHLIHYKSFNQIIRGLRSKTDELIL